MAARRPERVSPWEIEPFSTTASVDISQSMIKTKRPRPPLDLPLAGIKTFSFLLYFPADHDSFH